MELALWYPFSPSIISQGFGQNANTPYSQYGLLGHTRIDLATRWGTSIPNYVDGAFGYSLTNVGNPDLMQYRAVFTVLGRARYPRRCTWTLRSY